MKFSRPRKWLAIVLFLLVCFTSWTQQAESQDNRPTTEAINAPADVLALDSADGLLAARKRGNFLGSRSCAATACHGGVRPDPRFPLSRRNEFTVWLDDDPHVQGYRTLASEASDAILARLGIRSNGNVLDANGLANCYGCHNPQPSPSRRAETYFLRDGVHCEMCHGPAQNWVGAHYQAGWDRSASPSMIDTEDVRTRAKLCADCHVGSPGREVNHDLIAAGHPPLRFEFAAYHDALPKHWRQNAERDGSGRFELQLWSAGQIASAESALALLIWRAERATAEERGAIWPELAEYDCYSCHHDLMHPSWRRSSHSAQRPLGMAPWGTWHFSMLRRLAETDTASRSQANSSRSQAETALGDLADVMQRGFFVKPGDATQPAAGALRALRVWSSESGGPDSFLGRSWNEALARTYRASDSNLPLVEIETWDEATQRYLLLAAIEQSRLDGPGKANPNVDRAMSRLRERLAFPQGFDGPDESPSMPATRREIVDFLEQLARALKAAGE